MDSGRWLAGIAVELEGSHEVRRDLSGEGVVVGLNVDSGAEGVGAVVEHLLG